GAERVHGLVSGLSGIDVPHGRPAWLELPISPCYLRLRCKPAGLREGQTDHIPLCRWNHPIVGTYHHSENAVGPSIYCVQFTSTSSTFTNEMPVELTVKVVGIVA